MTESTDRVLAVEPSEVPRLAIADALVRMHEQFVVFGELWVEQKVKPLARALKSMQLPHERLAPMMYEDYRRHRIRCALCNPAGNPKPLAVNGAEYRRRTRTRRRRNRR